MNFDIAPKPLKLEFSWNRRALVECVIILAIVSLGPVLNLKEIYFHDLKAAFVVSHKFTFTTYKVIHRSWTFWDAIRAVIFFLSLAGLGLAAPWRAGLRVRWVLIFISGCWVTSFLFLPAIHADMDFSAILAGRFYMNVGLSALWTLLFTTSWARAERGLPTPLAVALSLSIFMSAHALTSFFYVFSLRP